MLKQTVSAPYPSTRRFMAVVFFVSVFAVCLPAQAELRGIPIIGGDSATTAITPPEDNDTFILDAFEDSKLTLTVKALKGSALIPDLRVLMPTGEELDTSAYRSVKGSKLTLKNVPLTMTGRWGFVVSSKEGTEGEYQVKTRLTPLKKKKRTDVLDPSQTMAYQFSAEDETEIFMTVKGQGGPFEVVSVTDPMGLEIPGAVDLFTYRKNKAHARLFPSRNSGDYLVTIGGISSTTQLSVQIKTLHRRMKSRKLVISPVEPIVESLLPDFGREDNGIGIIGKGFLPGKITVLFDDMEAPVATYVSATRLNVIVPPEGERTIVDITVYNPDGQEGMLEQSFTFIPPPPSIDSLTPTEGPDSGGTTIDIFGTNMTFVEIVEFGQEAISTKPEIVSDTHIRVVTDAHAPGTTTLTLTDRFGQTDFLSGAFYFAPPPSVDSVSPIAGSKKGGLSVELIGGGFRSDSQYLFGTVPATKVTVASLSQVFIDTPAHPKGVVDLTVEDKWGRQVIIPGGFEFVDGTLIDITGRAPAQDDQVDVSGTAVAIGDVDPGAVSDRIDIVLGSPTGGGGYTDPTRLVKNNGASGWSLDTGTRFDGLDAHDVALGDIDDDGDLDLVVTGDVLSTYSFRYKYTNYNWYYYWDEPDVATRIFVNDGYGAFTQDKTLLPRPLDGDIDLLMGRSLALGDVDDDDDLDLVVTGNSVVTISYYDYYYWSSQWGNYYYYYFYTYEDPSYTATRLLTNDGKGKFKNVSGSQLPDASDGDLFAGEHMILADADTDGDLDIIVTGDFSELRSSGEYVYVDGSKTRILVNNGKGYFTNGTATLMPDTKSWDDWGGKAVAVGDLDGDNVNDLVITTDRRITYDDGSGETHYSSTRVFKGGQNGFSEATTTFMPAVDSGGKGEVYLGVHCVIADPDGDGLDELFILHLNEVYALDPDTQLEVQVPSLRWLSKQGSLPLSDVTFKQFPDPAKTGDYYLGHKFALGDIDDDGDLDLVLTTTLPSYMTSGSKPTRILEFR